MLSVTATERAGLQGTLTKATLPSPASLNRVWYTPTDALFDISPYPSQILYPVLA